MKKELIPFDHNRAMNNDRVTTITERLVEDLHYHSKSQTAIKYTGTVEGEVCQFMEGELFMENEGGVITYTLNDLLNIYDYYTKEQIKVGQMVKMSNCSEKVMIGYFKWIPTQRAFIFININGERYNSDTTFYRNKFEKVN